MELCTAATRAEYADFVWNHPKGHYLQSPDWALVKRNWQWAGLIVRTDDGQICGTMSVLILPKGPTSLCYSPRGPVCDPADTNTLARLLQDAKRLAKERHAYVLKLDPDVDSANAAFADCVKAQGYALPQSTSKFGGIQPRRVLRLPLTITDPAALMQSFYGKTRYGIRLEQRKGVEVRVEDAGALPAFYALMQETGARDGFNIRPLEYFENFLAAMGDKARLYMAYYEGDAVSGAIALHHGDKIWYVYGASTDRHNPIRGNFLMQWTIIQWALDCGCRLYDFGGVPAEVEGEPVDGLTRFKRGFYPTVTEFLGEFQFVPSRAAHWAVEKALPIYTRLRAAHAAQ
ncbi:MAG: peptidoglycan bridge formation glycyltransferase FemA/FemB family protein [Oscillospiraceae bacterium]|jgi:lipid II:glycine glycyltransferase (peptidoglycan interpeptide bridge formation enzyme)|nr:peptidoglycan bridge formation glycyltransferase FemA/FemB family protein [Oscillospiraceae bacterium]